VEAEPTARLGEVEKDLESLKWHLWNGNVDQAFRLIERLKTMLEGEQTSPEQQKRLRTIREFGNYIAANHAYIPDYGDRHRDGERISSAFAESACQSANGQATTNALDRARRPPAVTGPRASDERRSAKHFQTLVFRHESGFRRPTSPRSLISSWPARGSAKESVTPRFLSDSLFRKLRFQMIDDSLQRSSRSTV
jgi:hypothetical protein